MAASCFLNPTQSTNHTPFAVNSAMLLPPLQTQRNNSAHSHYIQLFTKALPKYYLPSNNKKNNIFLTFNKSDWRHWLETKYINIFTTLSIIILNIVKKTKTIWLTKQKCKGDYTVFIDWFHQPRLCSLAFRCDPTESDDTDSEGVEGG